MSVEVSLEDFESEVLTFLEHHTVAKPTDEFTWGRGDDDTSVFLEVDADTERGQLVYAKWFRAQRFDAGLGWIMGPPQFGGRGLSRRHEALYHAIEARFQTPDMRFFGIGLGMVAPTILAHARETVQSRYLPRLFRGDLIACQLFSEPGAGSDIASVATKAERDHDGWVLSGQKVWTTGAQHADIGLILARTNPAVAKHKGISAFLVDMRAPGVTVRPLRQITGGASFNEVFFDEVRISDEFRLGDVDDGWRIALTTLLNERASIGAGGEASARLEFMQPERLIALLRQLGLDDDPVIRDQFAKIYIAQQVTRWNGHRAMETIVATGIPGPELSAAKLARTNWMRMVGEFVTDVLGPRLAADTGEWGTFAWTRFLLGAPGLRIAGGTDEIQKKIIGEQVLGLPKEPASPI